MPRKDAKRSDGEPAVRGAQKRARDEEPNDRPDTTEQPSPSTGSPPRPPGQNGAETEIDVISECHRSPFLRDLAATIGSTSIDVPFTEAAVNLWVRHPGCHRGDLLKPAQVIDLYKVADFLQDEPCCVLCATMLGSCMHSVSHYASFQQLLMRDTPEPLLTAAFRFANLQLPLALPAFPPALHCYLVQAQVDSDGALELRGSMDGNAALSALVLVADPAVRRLAIRAVPLANVDHVLYSCLLSAGLQHLEVLEIENTHPDFVAGILPGLHVLEQLTSLSLVGCRVNSDGQAHLSRLKSLKFLSLAENSRNTYVMEQLASGIAALTQLEALDLRGNSVAYANGAGIAPSLRRLRDSLTSLDLRDTMEPMAFEPMLHSLREMRALKHLFLRFSAWPRALLPEAAALLDAVGALPQLEMLELAGVPVGRGAPAGAWVRTLAALTQLHELQLNDCRGITRVVHLLQPWSLLQRLDLSQCRSDDDEPDDVVHVALEYPPGVLLDEHVAVGAAEPDPEDVVDEIAAHAFEEFWGFEMSILAQLVSQMPALRQFVLHGWTLNYREFEQLIFGLVEVPVLESIDISGFSKLVVPRNSMNNLMFALLERAGTLRDLNLCGLGVHNQAAMSALGLHLPGLSRLTALSLPMTMPKARPTGVSFAAAMSGLGQLKLLERINVAGNWLGRESIDVVAAALARLPTLTSLDLSSNPLCTKGMAELALGLRCSVALRHLVLAKCRITDAGCSHLAAALPALRDLRELNLNDNCMTDAGAAVLAGQLVSLTALDKLHLEDNKMTAAGRLAVEAGLRTMRASAWRHM